MSAALAAGVGVTRIGLKTRPLRNSFASCQQMINLPTKGALRNVAGNPAFAVDPRSPDRTCTMEPNPVSKLEGLNLRTVRL
jgi:hypothetical protein